MNAWQKSFEAMVILPHAESSMIGTIRSLPSGFSTDWSGYLLPASINPTMIAGTSSTASSVVTYPS